ncbi:MAG TPA: hypothetical protein VD861_10745 [Pyrinomonadaceae bacterium]|nr:hypothetical protein [Pyrinomonadaceae bacterium]
MRLPRHVAGFIVFFIILTCSEVISYYFTRRFKPAVRVKVATTATETPLDAAYDAPPVSHTVRLVSLDFINGKSYTTLTLQRDTSWPEPERLWVTTVFVSPESAPGRSWTTTTEVRNPFGTGNRAGITEITAEASCSWCARSGPPAPGYFARVYVWTEDGAHVPPPEAFDADITTAIPVVVQADRKAGR